ncbi:unnamed protein product, partial [Meganyctiphanes norvegica]
VAPRSSPWWSSQGTRTHPVTTMDQQPICRLIIVILSLTTISVHVTNADVICYKCSDRPGSDWYDADCGAYDYRGNAETVVGDWDICYIQIYDNGYVTRSYARGPDDGDCGYGSVWTYCYCKGDYCNTHSYCEQCGYPKPTPETTEHPTIHTETTTEPLPSTTYTNYVTTTDLKSTSTDATTIVPATSLRCFHCIDCATVSEGTTPIIEDQFLSCSTIVFLNSAEVIRGGTYEEHPDGECVEHTGSVSCWCSENLCNSYTISL